MSEKSLTESRFSYRGLEPDSSKAASSAARLKMRKFGYKSALTFSENFIAKKFGPLMPLMVAECLAKSHNAKENSTVKLSERHGWSWLVCGRKLFVWPLSEDEALLPDENATIVGKDLTLPPSDLAYSANLAVVFKTPPNQFVSCIAVSPEGVIRYWHTVRQHSSWVDVNSQLGGEEVCCILDIAPVGVLAVTTSASMILIQPRQLDSQKTVSVNIITDRQSWLGGFGKRVSALLGYLPAPHFMESGMKVVTQEMGEGAWKVVALAADSLQQWLVSQSQFHLLWEASIKHAVNSVFTSTLENDEISWDILDMKIFKSDSLMLLAVCPSLKSIVILKFSLSELSEGRSEASEVYSLSEQDFNLLYKTQSSVSCMFLDKHCLIYTNRMILAVTMKGTKDNESVGSSEVIQFHNGYFLGGCVYSGTPVFFSTEHSFVSLTPASPLHHVDSSTSSPLSNSGLLETELRDMTMSHGEGDTDIFNDAIKNAFLQHTKHNIVQAKAVISSTFPDADIVDDSALLKAILAVSEDVINQSSSRDPRSSTNNSNFREVSSLQLDVQMSQKEEVHSLYLLFIKDIIPLDRLGRVSYEESGPTRILDVLADHNERIIAARALYRIKTEYPNVIHQAICRVAENLKFPTESVMSYEEYFFTQVKYVYEGLKEICLLPEAVQKEGSAHDVYLKAVSDVNNILIQVITKLIRTSEKKKFLNEERKYIEHLASPGGLFQHLNNQATRSAVIGIKYKSTLEDSHVYMMQLFSLADIILFTQRYYASPEDFHALRTELIQYFVETKLYEEALALAEKFTHYPTLVKICFLTNDSARLNSYLDQYGDAGFCEELFKFYANSRMFSHLMNLPLSSEYQHRLATFLNDYPDIAWIYAAKQGDYSRCLQVLSRLGHLKDDYALRKTRILSMAKLAVLSGEVSAVEQVETQLHLLSVQQDLPKSLLNRIGFANKPVRTFSPSELIQLFICKENMEADEHHYKKALDLLPYVSDPETRDQLWEKIWERAVMTDRYSYQELGPPQQTVDRMLLFRLINLIILSEECAEEVIPSYKVLTNIGSLQQDISQDSQLKYIIRYGYEAFCESCGIHKSD